MPVDETKPQMTTSEKEPSGGPGWSADSETGAGKLDDTTPDEDDDAAASEYVTGFKLAIIVASVALACFLMLLDTMVISTVCSPHYQPLLLLESHIAHLFVSLKAIPRITDRFNSLADVGWYASAYQFGR